MTLAAQLVEQGRKNKSPLALAAGAELYASVGVKLADRAKTSEGGQAPAAGAEPAPVPAPDAAALYAEAAAAARAASDEALAEAIEKSASAAGSRSSESGGYARGHRDRVQPYATDVYVVRYAGGEDARATVAAIDETDDIDLYVYDGDGWVAALDRNESGVGICVWVPEYTRDYTLKVINRMGSQVDYLLYTN
jgi:hypothetical protein